VRDLVARDRTIELRVPEASLDAVVKAIARHHVVDVEITEADLEEMFLAYYGSDTAHAA
jgi:ABC-2 type transport system ATP-binding protein